MRAMWRAWGAPRLQAEKTDQGNTINYTRS